MANAPSRFTFANLLPNPVMVEDSYKSKLYIGWAVQACPGLRLVAPARSLRLGERDSFWIRLKCHQTDATVRSMEFVYDPGLGQGFNVPGW